MKGKLGKIVEINVAGSWGGLCDQGFGLAEANVVCRQFGYHLGAKKVNDLYSSFILTFHHLGDPRSGTPEPGPDITTGFPFLQWGREEPGGLQLGPEADLWLADELRRGVPGGGGGQLRGGPVPLLQRGVHQHQWPL